MLKRIEVNLKNGMNYILYDVSKYSDLTFGPIWFWVEWEDGTRRYIASSDIQDIWIQDEEKKMENESKKGNILYTLREKIGGSSK